MLLRYSLLAKIGVNFRDSLLAYFVLVKNKCDRKRKLLGYSLHTRNITSLIFFGLLGYSLLGKNSPIWKMSVLAYFLLQVQTAAKTILLLGYSSLGLGFDLK